MNSCKPFWSPQKEGTALNALWPMRSFNFTVWTNHQCKEKLQKPIGGWNLRTSYCPNFTGEYIAVCRVRTHCSDYCRLLVSDVTRPLCPVRLYIPFPLHNWWCHFSSFFSGVYLLFLDENFWKYKQKNDYFIWLLPKASLASTPSVISH